MEPGNQKIVLALLLVVGLVAIAACIIGAVALSKDRPPAINVRGGDVGSQPAGGDGASGGAGGAGGGDSAAVPSATGATASGATAGKMTASGRIIYTIMVGHDYGAYEYIDEGGYLTGFHYDLIYEVCLAAGIECRTIWDAYKNCWDSEPGQHSVGGEGLMDRWYDACSGYYATVGRIHVFDFSMPYLKEPTAYFFTKKGTTISTSDITGKKIGFIDGWASDEKCLARHNGTTPRVLPISDITYAPTGQALVDMIKAGTVDAGFATIETMDKYVTAGDIDKMDKRFACFLSGDSLMTRKDNGFNSLWNRGFQQIRNSGKYRKICATSQEAHGHMGLVDCI